MINKNRFYCLIACLCCFIFPLASVADVAVEIAGIEDVRLHKNVQNSLTILRDKNDPSLDKTRINALVNEGYHEIKRALQPYGYYHVKVSAKVTHKADMHSVHYQVELGKPIIIQTLDVKLVGAAKNDAKFSDKFKSTSLAVHQVLDQTVYEQFKKTILSLSASRGYFDALFTRRQITIDTEHNTAHVELHFDSGKRYRFGPITFTKIAYDESFLRRFLTFSQGEPYDEKKLLSLQQRLSNQFFSFVQVAPLLEKKANLQVPVHVTLKARKPVELGMGAGYGTDTGMRMLFKGHWYRATRMGHQLTSVLRLSEYANTAQLGYVIPGSDPVEDQLALSLLYHDERPKDDVSHSQTTQLSAKYLTGNPLLAWSKTYALNAQMERFDNVNETQNATLVFPEITLERIKADGRFNTQNGYGLDISTRGALKGMGSSVSFLQMTVGGKWIHSFSSRQRVLLRSKLGATLSDAHDDVPRSLRFFAGGDKSVRGFAYETLAPEKRDANGRKIIVGGAHLLVGSVELEQKFADKWSFAGFFDIGSAFDSFQAVDLGQSVGVGMRWHSPIGPVRVDLAHPLNRNEQLIRLHFSIGPDL